MKFADLFCGMGTMRLGFEQANWECVWSCDFDKHKRRIYEVIFGHEPEGRDITTVRANDIPPADCWTFGAPCQDFSIAGIRKGMDGDRSSLVREVFRLVRETTEEHRPEWLLYENVKGMLSSNKGLDYLEILFEMGSLGYDIEWQLLNSKDFGVPQNRERVYTLGHLGARGERKVFPVGESGKQTPSVMTLITKGKNGKEPHQHERIYNTNGHFTALSAQMGGRNYIVDPQVVQIGNVMPTAIRDNPNQGRVYDPSGLAPCLSCCEGGNLQPFILGSLQAHARLSTDGICPTITGAMGMGGGQIPMIVQDRIRRLTPRECMRLQGVADYITDKLIAAGISDTQMYRAAGDACTVNVIYEIAKRL